MGFGFQVSLEAEKKGLWSFLWTWVTGRLMVPVIETLKLEWVVSEGLDYEEFGFQVLSLRYWKNSEAEIFSNRHKMNGSIQS